MSKEDEGKWITVNGRHVLLKEGESVADAIKNGKKSRSKSQHHKDQNVSNVLETLGWTGKDKPMFIDKVTHGYRISLYTKDEKKAVKAQSNILKKTGVKVTLRKRTGYGAKAGQWDMVVPFYSGKK